jgi:hypothetical protein
MEPLTSTNSKDLHPVARTGAEPDVDPEKSTTPDSPEAGEAPDGGTAAWLVAAGGSALFFCCLGFSNSFGAFAEYYLSHQLRGESPGNIAWIGSLSAFLQFFSGMLGGPLFDRFGAWVCTYMASDG